MKYEVNGRVVVITGASSGIGRATALKFAENGDTVVVAARRKNLLNGLVEECEELGSEVQFENQKAGFRSSSGCTRQFGGLVNA